MTRRRLPLIAIGLVVLSSACTGGATDASTTTIVPDTTTTTVPPTTTTTSVPRTDGELVIGLMTPDEAYPELAAAMSAGVDLAMADIAQAGAPLGPDVRLVTADMTAGAVTALESLIVQRADVVIGAPTSPETEAIMPTAVEEGVIVISPTNSAPELSDLDDHGLFFRTASSDALQGAALARLLIDSGEAGAVAVVHRDDSYGRAIGERLSGALAESGGPAPVLVPYRASEIDVDAVVDAAGQAATVVLVSLDEASQIVTALRARTPAAIWVTEPAFGVLGDLIDDPGVLAGVSGLIHLPFPDMPQEFLDRLQDSPEQPTVLTYASEAYDAVVIAALAAEAAAGDAPRDLAAVLPGITREGEACASYGACRDLIATGTDIDYDGISGRLELDDSGEPTVGVWEWSRYDAEGAIEPPIGLAIVG